MLYENHVHIIYVDELRHFEIKLPRIQLAPWRNELNCSGGGIKIDRSHLKRQKAHTA